MRPMGCALPKMRFWHAQEIVHEICFELTKQISVSGRGNPNGFPLAAAYFRAHRKGMPRLHPFRKPKYRQIGVRGAKAWFCLRESFYKSIHEKSFKLIKLFSVIFRDNPPLRDDVASAAGFLALRAFRGTPLRARANSLFPQKPQVCGQWGALCQKCDFGTRKKLFTKFVSS